MHSTISHMQFNVRPENMTFYKDLLGFLGWKVLYDGEGMLGVGTGNPAEGSLWFAGFANDAKNDYDGAGLNHFAFGVDSIEAVDQAAAYLAEHNVQHLFETPRHRPEFSNGPDDTYYQVMFETPDRILIEIVYIGAK